jgi:hypothetical protein
MIDFDATLNILLEDANVDWQPMAQAQELVQQLGDAKRKLTQIKHQLSMVKNQIIADLAMQIRRHSPALNVGLDHGYCKVGYKTKHLLLTPDLINGVWKVKASDANFANKFQKARLRDLFLDSSIEVLIQSISDYFLEHYKTLEEGTGCGILLIEGKISYLADLVRYRDSFSTNHMPLKSRRARLQ